MKTVGILLLFGLCTAIGIRIAAKKTERYRMLEALIRDLRVLSETVETGQNSLPRISQEQDGVLFEMLRRYLAARNAQNGEQRAAFIATETWEAYEPEHGALISFFAGLSEASSGRMRDRIAALMQSLSDAEKEAEKTAKQAKTIRVVGVLIGVGVCILLI